MKKDWQKNVILVASLVLAGMGLVFLKKENYISFVNKSLTPDEAGLFLGIVFGEKETISKYWFDVYKKVGVLHVVVASGANLSILSLLIIENLAWLIGRKRAILIGISLTAIYIKLVGYGAPIIRALIIFLIYIWAKWVGRKFNIVTAMILMFLVLLVVDLDIFKQISFWMSLLAFGGTVSFSSFIKKKKWKLKGLWLNMWINLLIWPITALFFGEINWLCLLTNPLLLFSIETVFSLGIVVLVLWLVWPGLASGVVMLVLPFLRYFNLVCEMFSKVSLGTIKIGFNWLMLVGWYIVLLSLVLKLKLRVDEK